MMTSNSAAPLSELSQAHIRLSVHQTLSLDTPPPTKEAIANALMAVAAAISQADLYEQIHRHASVLMTASAIVSCFATSKAILCQEFSASVYEAAMFFRSLAMYLLDMQRNAYISGCAS